MSKFLDRVEIDVEAGDGGNGCCAFRREKFVPRGGPSGGDGGKGGDVVILASPHLNTLLPLRYKRLFRAGRGGHGEGSDRHGRDGEDCIVEVPPGTQIYMGNLLVGDLDSLGKSMVVAKGGWGGFGNAHYKSAVNRAPRRQDPGHPGECRHLRLELKLLADVGLLGFPNAGKSTLISRISNARPRIADYPFTTMEPHLGVVAVDQFTSFVMADIPGLIEGASDGKGLGKRFLKHLERCKLLLHLVEPFSDPCGRFLALEEEIRKAGGGLSEKPMVIVLTKCDTMPPDAESNELRRLEEIAMKRGVETLRISAVSGQGLRDLVACVAEKLRYFTSPSEASSS